MGNDSIMKLTTLYIAILSVIGQQTEEKSDEISLSDLSFDEILRLSRLSLMEDQGRRFNELVGYIAIEDFTRDEKGSKSKSRSNNTSNLQRQRQAAQEEKKLRQQLKKEKKLQEKEKDKLSDELDDSIEWEGTTEFLMNEKKKSVKVSKKQKELSADETGDVDEADSIEEKKPNTKPKPFLGQLMKNMGLTEV